MHFKRTSVILLSIVAFASLVFAQEQATQPSLNWQKQVGEVANNPDQIRLVIEQVPALERADFSRRVLQAISSLPVAPEVKAQRFSQAVVSMVAGAGESKRDVVGAIFAATPMQFLGAVSQALSAGFDQKKNNLSDEEYLKIATNLMSGVVEQLAKDDKIVIGTGLADDTQAENVARLSTAAATLIRSASAPDAVETALMAYFPVSSHSAVAQILPQAIKGDYGPLLDFAGADARMVLPVIFSPAMIPGTLLSHLEISRTADESRFVSVGIERTWGNRRPLPIIPIPRGYQNQGIPGVIPDFGDFFEKFEEQFSESELIHWMRTLPTPCGDLGVPFLPGGCSVPLGPPLF